MLLRAPYHRVKLSGGMKHQPLLKIVSCVPRQPHLSFPVPLETSNKLMKKMPSRILWVAMVWLCGFALSGCQKDTTTSPTSFSLNEPVGEDDTDEDVVDWGEDHPEHGPRGGHMIQLSNDAETEVGFDEEAKLFSVYLDGLGDVTAVKMTTTIEGEETVYEFERTDTPVGTIYGLLDEELASAVMKGKDVTQTLFTITTADGDLTAEYEYHAH